MFKKLKDKIEEEFKQAPLKFPVSVQQLAQVISPSQSVNSLSDNNASSSLTYPTDVSNVSNDLFSIGGDEDPQDGFIKMPLTLHSVDLTASSPANMTQNTNRSRRSSLSSVTSEASSLFPINESSLNQNFFQSDLESEMEDGHSLSKEQLYQMFKKILNRYNKYKGRYTELLKHCKELQHENFKTKNVLQESQDKALRRMAELREQCQLEQKAKAHLEESLRNDVEERDHIINTLRTKISLLSNGTESGQLINLELDSPGAELENHPQSKELWHLKSQNDELQKEVERLKKIKETACNLIHKCDTTINEATEDIKNDNIKQKMSELKSDIQKMKLENESLSHLLSRNIITEDDRKSQTSMENSLIGDLSGLEYGQGDQKVDEREKKIEKLNNLLLKCKEKINGLTAELKAKDIIIKDNNKQLKELKEEVGAFKTREEENALSVAENKKAIHEELSAKEEQIKALTKELKTKENEFIKEKEEVIKSFEDKIRTMTSDFTEEIKLKNEQNQKLQEDLKAREIASGTLEKVKSIEENLAKMSDFVKAKSLDFEEFAKLKTAEIGKAQQRLEERLTIARKNLTELVQNSQKSKAPEQIEEFTQRKLFEVHSEVKNPNLELSENFHTVEKLKSDVINLSKKLEILESELEDSKKSKELEKQEKDKWREQHAIIEGELEKIKNEYQKKINENAELDRALTDKNEKIKKVESEKKLLQKATTEKVETESKLKEYIENYTKLEKENQTLQNDLVERCGKLLKELTDSKEKIKTLENQEKAKANELEQVKNQYSNDVKVKSEENERLKNEVEALKTEINEKREELDKIRTSTEEGEARKTEIEGLREKIKQQEEELEKRDGRTKELENDLANIQKEISQEKRSSETIRNELDALRNNLKLELKEKDEKSILVDKLTQECNLLLGEIENLKKTHGKAEKKLETDLETARNEISEKTNLVEKLQEELDRNKKENENSTTGVEELRRKYEELTGEMEVLRNEQTAEKQANEKLRNLLSENEVARQELNDKISGLTAEKSEIFGELQVKLSEIETLKNGLKSVREELEERTKAFEEEKVCLLSENENKLNILKNEIKFINTKHEEDIGNFEENLNSEMKEVSEKMEIAEKASAELLEKLEKITNERDELKMAEEEKNLKISELESCLKALKMELDEKFNDDSKEEEEIAEKHGEEIKQIIIQYDSEIAQRDEEIESLQYKLSNEEEMNSDHREEVKQIILQYDKEIAERDEEVESLKLKLSGYDDAIEHLKIAKEELKILRKELAEKDNVTEEKIKEAVRLKQDQNKNQTEEGVETLRERLRELERKLEEQTAEVERLKVEKDIILEQERTNWEEKMAELSREPRASSSQKKNVSTEKSGVLVEPECMEEVELECTSKVPVAALESGSGSIELLQKQLIQQAEEMKELKKQHKREIIELKKASMSRRRGRKNSSDNQDWLTGGGLENDTEHEYLRNILYEYMMGKEQLVLAKVLSAIVKFNEEQTHNVLEKEQQRQTLVRIATLKGASKITERTALASRGSTTLSKEDYCPMPDNNTFYPL